MSNQLLLGDCLEVLKTFPDNYFDSCVTDPPYEISFMTKKWDNSGIAFKPETWAAVLRVLRPGAHLLAFGGTRTSHRMVCAIEDAGFEIRDSIRYMGSDHFPAWIYSQGFPKSMDISKAIDKMAGVEREVIGERDRYLDGIKRKSTVDYQNTVKIGENAHGTSFITAPATDAAKQYAGFGSALKPAQELICLARKPLSEPTIAANVLKWSGCGGLNIDKSRLPVDGAHLGRNNAVGQNGWKNSSGGKSSAAIREEQGLTPLGRWPSNVIIDDSPEVLAEFAKFGEKTSGKPNGAKRNVSGPFLAHANGVELTGYGDTGSVARFFYSAKASRSERGEFNDHPCVKPLNLMKYLITLITPPGGTVLDPFMGSGSTGVAAVSLGFNFVGIEMDEHYFNICQKRIENTQPALLHGEA